MPQERMKIATYGELTELRVRGLFALMMQQRHVEPTEDEWDILNGEREITARDLGEIAGKYGFEVNFMSQPLKLAEAEE